MTRRVGPSEQGQLQGANGSLNGIANMIAPILFTQIFAFAVGRYRAANVPGAPFLLASLFLCGGADRRVARNPAGVICGKMQRLNAEHQPTLGLPRSFGLAGAEFAESSWHFALRSLRALR